MSLLSTHFYCFLDGMLHLGSFQQVLQREMQKLELLMGSGLDWAALGFSNAAPMGCVVGNGAALNLKPAFEGVNFALLSLGFLRELLAAGLTGQPGCMPAEKMLPVMLGICTIARNRSMPLILRHS